MQRVVSCPCRSPKTLWMLSMYGSETNFQEKNLIMEWECLFMCGNFTLFEVFWLVHVAVLRRPPRKSIDYLLRAISRWQRVLNHCLVAIFHSLLTTDTINCYMSLVYEGFSSWGGSLGNVMNVTKHLSLTDGDAAHPCAVQGSFCAWTGPMRDDDTLNVVSRSLGPCMYLTVHKTEPKILN